MRVITTCLLVLIGTLLAYPAKAAFQAIPGSSGALVCIGESHFYSAQSANLPPNMAENFSGKNQNLRFRVCADAEGNSHYFVRRLQSGRSDICRVFEDEIFPGDSGDGIILSEGPADSLSLKGWKFWPPPQWETRHYYRISSEFAVISDQHCPPADDARYIPVVHVTDGILKSFDQLWSRTASSSRAFTRSFAETVVHSDPVSREATMAVLRIFRGWLFGPLNPKPVPKLLACDEGRVAVCIADIQQFEIDFDVTEHGLVIVGVKELLPL